MRRTISSSSRARSGWRLRERARQGGADVGGDVEARAERAVVDVADQRFLFLVAGAGQVDERARIGGDDHADRARQAEAQGEVVLGGRVLDLADAGGHAVEPADDALLHGGGQAGDAAARDAGLGSELLPVAGHLHDGPEA